MKYIAHVLFVLALAPVFAHAEIDEQDIAGTVGVRAADRADLRDALNASDRAAITRASRGAPQQQLTLGNLPSVTDAGMSPQQVGTQVVVQSQSSADASSDADSVENSSRSELMRRQRTREEIKNEDVLQERLESLRLRDERSRIGTVTSGWDQAEQQAYAQSAPAQPVVAAPVATPENIEALTRSSTEVESTDEKTTMYVQGRGGVAMMRDAGDGFEVNSRYSLGVGLGFVVSNHLSVEAGYTFNEYGIASTNNYYGGYYGQPQAQETVAMKQNVVDLGLKFHVTGPDSRIRPFVSGGAAYSKSFVNYDESIMQQYGQQGQGSNNPYLQDYEISAFQGYLGTGLDVRLSRTVSIGGNFRYYAVFSSRENQTSNNPYNGYNYGYAVDPQKQLIGSSLAKRSFYTLFAGLTFIF